MFLKLSCLKLGYIILFTKISLATIQILSNQPKLMKRVKPDITYMSYWACFYVPTKRGNAEINITLQFKAVIAKYLWFFETIVFYKKVLGVKLGWNGTKYAMPW